MKQLKGGKLKASRVFLAMGIIVGTLFGADGIRRSFESRKPYNLKIQGNFLNSGTVNETEAGSSLSFNASEQMDKSGYTEYELSKNDLSKGLLAIYTDSKPATEEDQLKMADLYEEKNECFILSEEHLDLNEDAALALNSMMEDYVSETMLTDFIVYGTTDTYTDAYSHCPQAFAESKAGGCIDLALYTGGEVLTYDGCDAQGWIVENCWKYGFVVRYPKNKENKTGNEYCPWHLRYVGDIHAAIMNHKGMCLEEYIEFLEQYTFEEPYSFSFNNIAYQIYTVPCSGDTITINVPSSGDYEISGDNRNSFIVTALKI